MAISSTALIAVRNLGRSRRRTALALAAIAFAELAIVLYEGIVVGYGDTLVASVTGPMLGHAQIHPQKWREDRAVDRTLPRLEGLLSQVRSSPGVRAAHARIYAPALVALGEDGQASVVVGLDMTAESQDGVLAGASYQRLPQTGEALVGEVLARKLQVQPGDELALVGQASDGSIASALFRVASVVGTQVDLLNRLGLLVRLADAQETFALENSAHEISVIGFDPQGAQNLSQELSGLNELKAFEVLPWQRLAPEISNLLDILWAYEYFLLALVFVAASAGAANTMMMSTFERTRELGMLLALGARPGRLVSMVLLESTLIGILGLVLGAALGLSIIGLTHQNGIDLSALSSGASESISFVGMKLSMRVFPSVSWPGLARSAVAVLLTSVLAAMWPATRAARLEPVEAMRT